jgi:hypothetical protein
MRARVIRNTIAFASCLFAAPSFAIHLCTDLNGKKVYQDWPCASNPSTSKIVPIQAKEVTEENARETVKRFGAALSARDPQAAFAMVSHDLEATVLYNGEIRKVNSAAYKEFVHRSLIAVDKYEIKYDCKRGSDRDRPREVILVCKVDNSAKSNTEQAKSTRTETLYFVVERGDVKIRIMKVTDI